MYSMDRLVVKSSDFYMTQAWTDRVCLRLYNSFISSENLVKAARHFLSTNKGFYLGAWENGEGDSFPVPKANSRELVSFIKTSAGYGTLHFFLVDGLGKNRNVYIDLAVLNECLRRYQ